MHLDRVTVFSFGITLISIGIIVLALNLRRPRPAAVTVSGRAAVAPTRRAIADEADAASLTRHLRIVADDGDWAMWTTTPQRVLPAAPVEAVPDVRTAEIIVDPTLKPRDLVGVVEHVAPGVGSVASVAALDEATGLRTPAQIEAYEADWAAALAVKDEQDVAAEVRAMFVGFDAAVQAQFREIDHIQARVAGWSFYAHDAEGHECPHCAEALAEISQEHRQIVSAYDTQAWDVRGLRAALASA